MSNIVLLNYTVTNKLQCPVTLLFAGGSVAPLTLPVGEQSGQLHFQITTIYLQILGPLNPPFQPHYKYQSGSQGDGPYTLQHAQDPSHSADLELVSGSLGPKFTVYYAPVLLGQTERADIVIPPLDYKVTNHLNCDVTLLFAGGSVGPVHLQKGHKSPTLHERITSIYPKGPVTLPPFRPHWIYRSGTQGSAQYVLQETEDHTGDVELSSGSLGPEYTVLYAEALFGLQTETVPLDINVTNETGVDVDLHVEDGLVVYVVHLTATGPGSQQIVTGRRIAEAVLNPPNGPGYVHAEGHFRPHMAYALKKGPTDGIITFHNPFIIRDQNLSVIFKELPQNKK